MKDVEYKELSRWNRYELQIYSHLGLNKFRKAILKFENIKHYKDDHKNENYHPANFSVFALEKYNGFLVYNIFLHSLSLLFIVAYLVLTFTFKVRIALADIIIFILSMLNIYCIILQRAINLKVRKCCYRYYKRFLNITDLCSDDIVQKIYAKEPQHLYTDYKVICRIKDAFEGKSDCFLHATDIESLKRISECIEPVSPQKFNRRTEKVRESGLIDKCNSITGPYTEIQVRADWLQRRFGLSGRKLLDCTVIITENADCEMLYKKLIPEDTSYNMCFACFQLYELFSGIVERLRKNEI